MSFVAPWRLAIVVLPIALLVAYLIVQRGRRTYALRFTSVDLLASVAPRRPGWQRHISAALLLLAVLALVLGFARQYEIPSSQRVSLHDKATRGSSNDRQGVGEVELIGLLSNPIDTAGDD